MTFTINWKTTLAGTTAILTAVGDALTQLTTGHWDPGRLMADWTGLVAGIGLIFAKDGNVTGGTKAATPEAEARVAK
jgi:hypothetical protein